MAVLAREEQWPQQALGRAQQRGWNGGAAAPGAVILCLLGRSLAQGARLGREVLAAVIPAEAVSSLDMIFPVCLARGRMAHMALQEFCRRSADTMVWGLEPLF